jgi:peptide/nickel transport system permease protein
LRTYEEAVADPRRTVFLPGMGGRGRELANRARIAFWRNPVGALGLLLVGGMVLVAVFAPQIATHAPNKLDPPSRLQPPSAEHLFGTDALGRDIFSRVVYGSRISLGIAVAALAIAVPLGGAFGIMAGYSGGTVDLIVMRITDIFLAFPVLILALAVNAALGPGLKSAVIAVSLGGMWPPYSRVIRGQVMAAKNELYVEAARSIGAHHWRIVLVHILPNCIGPIIIKMTLDAGFVVLATAGLSFVGLGAQPPTAEWGYMVTEGRQNILTQWWWPVFPGLAIAWLVVGLNLVGDFLRDLLDPRLRGAGLGA